MDLLAELGFIKLKGSGLQKYRYVLLVHSAYLVEQLAKDGKLDESWHTAYVARQLEAKESKYDNPAAAPSLNVVEMRASVLRARAKIATARGK
jgi:hypothetical protein